MGVPVRLVITDTATPESVALEMSRARAEAIVAVGRTSWPRYLFSIEAIGGSLGFHAAGDGGQGPAGHQGAPRGVRRGGRGDGPAGAGPAGDLPPVGASPGDPGLPAGPLVIHRRRAGGPPAVPARLRVLERSSLAGALLGLFAAITFGGAAHAEPDRVLYGLPAPQEITAYTAAICSAVLTAFNTLWFIYSKVVGRPAREPGKRKKADESKPTGPTGGDAPNSPPA